MPTVLSGKHFLICDDNGDVVADEQGLFALDTRFISGWQVRIDGQQPETIGVAQDEHSRARIYQRNIAGSDLKKDQLIVHRTIVVTDAMYQRLSCANLTKSSLSTTVSIAVESDFHDLFAVKEAVFSTSGQDAGSVASSVRLHSAAVREADDQQHRIVLKDQSGAALTLTATQPFSVSDNMIIWRMECEPEAEWVCDIQCAWANPSAAEDINFSQVEAGAVASTQAASKSVPIVRGNHEIETIYSTSVSDLHSLDISAALSSGEVVSIPAAGLPWFMTPFGRDSIITSLQSIVVGPNRARSVLRYLADRQATVDNPKADAEPGKILHEVREGALASSGYDTYFGTVDATPLFLVLLERYYRWSLDDDLVHELRPNAEAAVGWMIEAAKRGSGFLSYERRTESGLENQSWKDSWDSQRFHDGTFGEFPIAPAEAQGYAYDAAVKTAGLARDVWGDAAAAKDLEQWANSLKQRFNEKFWITPDQAPEGAQRDARASGYYCLGVDGRGRQLDSLTSNIGHLLWSGIVPASRASAVVEQLDHPALFNGWGIRTMSTIDAAYNPLAYHNGTVWPHDVSICIAGMMNAGAEACAARHARSMLDAAAEFDGRLPEVFAGLDRRDTRHPVQYPTASRPQAWAAGAPLFMLTTLMGLAPHQSEPRLTSYAQSVPEWLEGLVIERIQACGALWDVSVIDGAVTIAAVQRAPRA